MGNFISKFVEKMGTFFSQNLTKYLL